MPLDEYGNEIPEEQEPQLIPPERKNKYAGRWNVPGLPMSPRGDTLMTERPVKANKYSGRWSSLPAPPPPPPKKSGWIEAKEMAKQAMVGPSPMVGEVPMIPSGNFLKKYTDPEYIKRVDTAEHFKKTISNFAKSAKGLVPGLVTLADKTVGAISRPGHAIMERGMEQAAAQKAREMGMKPPVKQPGGALEPLKNMADLALWAPKLIADVIKDPIGTVENRAADIVMLAAGGALHKGIKEAREPMTVKPIEIPLEKPAVPQRPIPAKVFAPLESVRGTKIASQSGEPILMYRGTRLGSPREHGAGWTTDKEYARHEAEANSIKLGGEPIVISAYLKVKNPAIDPGYNYGKEIPFENDAIMTPNMHEVYVSNPSQVIEVGREPVGITLKQPIINPAPDIAGVIPREQMPTVAPKYGIELDELGRVPDNTGAISRWNEKIKAEVKARSAGPGEVKGLGIEFVNDKGEPISRAEAFRGKQARIEPAQTSELKKVPAIVPPPEAAEQPPMVRDFFEKIKAARRLTPKQKNLYSIERRKRLAQAMEAGKKMGGRAGWEAQQKALSGSLERVDFEPLKLTPEHADALFQYIEDSPAVLGFEKIATKNGLMKMLGERGAGIPQPKELSLLKDVFGPEITRTLIGNKPWWTRAWELGVDVMGISRAAITSGDLSFGLRQGIVYMARHPIRFWKDFPKQVEWFASGKASKIVLDDIRTRENYPLAREAGLDIIGKEEPFQSRLAEKIPIIKESSRAYTTFASKMRMDGFDSRIKDLQRMGINLHENLELAKKEAMLINTVTGRGQLKRLAPIQKELNAAFFSPHLALSRLNMLNPVWYAKLPKVTRIEALKYAASFASYGATLLGLAMACGLGVGWEPTSADFLKIKIGDTRIDPFGGFSQYIRTFFQLKENKITSSTSGKVMKLGEGYKPTTRFDLLFRFAEAKEAPVFSFATGLLKGQNWIGEKFELGKEAINRFVPMVIQDFIDIYKEEPDLLPVGFLGIFGIGLQTYGPGSYKKRHGQRTSLR